jgi:hypothetical protein
MNGGFCVTAPCSTCRSTVYGVCIVDLALELSCCEVKHHG